MGNRAPSVAVTVAILLAVGGLSLWFGAPLSDARTAVADQLCGSGTLLGVPPGALAIRLPIVVGLVGFGTWLWRADHAARPRVAAVLTPLTLALVLSAVWQGVLSLPAQAPAALWFAAAAGAGSTVGWMITIRRLTRFRPNDLTERILLDGTFGLSLGWTTVGLAITVGAAGHASGLHPAPFSAALIALAAIIALAMVGVLFQRTLGARAAIGIAMAWTFGWIAIARWGGGGDAQIVAASAIAGAVLVLGSLAVVRSRASTAGPGAQAAPS